MNGSPFRKIDFLFTVSGHQFSPQNRCQRILRFVLLTCVLIRFLISTHSDLVLDPLNHGQLSLYNISDMFFFAFFFAFHVALLCKRQEIREFLSFHHPLVPKSGIEELERLSVRFLLYFFAYLIAENVSATCFDLPFGVCHWKAGHVLFPLNQTVNSWPVAVLVHLAFVYESAVIMSWMALALCLYSYSRAFKNVIIADKMKSMIHLLVTRRSEDRDLEFTLFNTITDIQNSFDATFSVFPFLVFAANFLQTSGYVLYMVHSTAVTPGVRTSSILMNVTYLIIPVLFCKTPDSQREISRLGVEVVSLLERGIMSQSSSRLITLIERLIHRKENACLFDFGPTTILVFAGHIISFAVIFFQLMPPH